MPEKEVDVLDPVAEEARKEYEAEKAAAEGKELPKKEETLPKKEEEGGTLKKEEESEEEKVEKKEEGKEKKKEPEPKSDEELLEAEDEDLNDEERETKQGLIKEQEDVILDKEEKDLTDEEKTQKAEIIQKRDDASKAAFDENVKAYAKKKEISEDDARKTLESADKLLKETFKDDAKELARTHLHLQRLYDKTLQEYKNLRDMPAQQPLTIDGILKSIDAGHIKSQGKPADRAMIVEIHREANPDITEGMEDDTVLKLAAKEIMTRIEQSNETSQVRFSADAKEKKIQLLKSISDTDKKFAPDIEAVVNKMSDYQIMATQSLADTILWAKGKSYDQDVTQATKDAEERGFRRGQASRRVKTGPIGTGGLPKGKAGVPALSSKQQEEAWKMFPQAKDDKDAFSMYSDVMKSRKPKK